MRREGLLLLKLKAMRRGVWFKALNRIDRTLFDLAVKVVDAVRGRKLAEALLSIVRKLEEALENGISKAVKEVGLPLARKLSLIAQRWGNHGAGGWASDVSFARFLAIMHINSPSPW